VHIRTRLLAPLLAIAAFPLVALAQTASADVPEKAEVMKFLELMHARDQMTRAMQGMESQMRQGVEQGFKSKVPNATPEMIEKLDDLFLGTFKDFPVDEMVNAIVPIYQKHLTKADLVAITAFYSSPPGQKILKEMPAITAEAMQAGGDIGRRVFAEKEAEFDKKMDDFIEQAKKDATQENNPTQK